MDELIRLRETHSKQLVYPPCFDFLIPADRPFKEIWIHTRSGQNRRSGKILAAISLKVNGCDTILSGQAEDLRLISKYQDPIFGKYIKYRPGIYRLQFLPAGIDPQAIGINYIRLELSIAQPGWITIYQS